MAFRWSHAASRFPEGSFATDGSRNCASTSWLVMQPTIVLDARDQLLAFACAGHPRCGAASPARLLWLRDPRAAAAVRDACFFQRSFRVAVFEGHHKPYHVLAFGVSPATLGVTSAPVLAPLAPLAPPKGRDSADRVLSENMVLTWDSPSRDMFVLSRQSSCGEGNYHDWPRKLALRGAEWDRYLLPIVHGRWMILRSRVGGEIVVVDLEAPEPHETMARMAPPWYLVHVANYRRFSDEVVLLAQDHPNESLLIALVDLRRTFTSRSLAVVSVIRFPNEALPEGWKWFEAGMSLGMRAFHLKKQKQHRNYRLVDEIGSGGSGDGDGDGGDVALVFLKDQLVVHVEIQTGRWTVIHRGKCEVSQVDSSLFCLRFLVQGRGKRTADTSVEVWDVGNTHEPLRRMEFQEQQCSFLCGGGLLIVTTGNRLQVMDAASGSQVMSMSFNVAKVGVTYDN